MEWTWKVAVYFAGIDRIFEHAIWDTAKEYDGDLGGSGSLLVTGQREMTVVFPDETRARRYASRIEPLYKAKVKVSAR